MLLGDAGSAVLGRGELGSASRIRAVVTMLTAERGISGVSEGQAGGICGARDLILM
jgi:hypothetical protein